MKFKIRYQGAPVVNIDAVSIIHKSKNLVAVELDMRSKWCEIGGTFGDTNELGFILCATEQSLHLNEEIERDKCTSIIICDYSPKLWDFFCIECNRYTTRIVLTAISKE